jgi:hypothetical protein
MLKVFENVLLRKIFGSTTEEVTEVWGKKCILRSFAIYIPS